MQVLFVIKLLTLRLMPAEEGALADVDGGFGMVDVMGMELPPLWFRFRMLEIPEKMEPNLRCSCFLAYFITS